MSTKPTVNAGLYRHLTDSLDFLNHGRAACANEDPELFFDDTREHEAARICRGCPVRDGCKAWAIATQPAYGVWGGLTEKVRKAPEKGNPNREIQAAARRLDVADLDARGFSPAEIAARLGVNPDSIYADLSRMRRAEIVAKYPSREERIDAACRGEQVLIGVDETCTALDRVDDGSRTLAAITGLLHVSVHTVYKRRRDRERERVAA